MSGKITSAVAVSGDRNYETRLTSRQHNLVADEEPEDGGLDTGPRPGELMCMSLASCTAITLRMYAQRKSWDTGMITVTVTRTMHEHETEFNVEIHFEKLLDAEVRDRLLLVSKKCPVHKVLTHPIRIEANIV